MPKTTRLFQIFRAPSGWNLPNGNIVLVSVSLTSEELSNIMADKRENMNTITKLEEENFLKVNSYCGANRKCFSDRPKDFIEITADFENDTLKKFATSSKKNIINIHSQQTPNP